MKSLKPGDIFCSESLWIIGRAINAVQAWWAKDSQSRYSHAGIIIDPEGLTLEAMWRVRSQKLLTAYSGRRVLIGRHENMDMRHFLTGIDAVIDQYGDLYPLHRLLLFLVPPLARRVNVAGWTVCSEYTAKFLHAGGMMDYWSGVNPDDLADMIRNWRNWSIVYEGKLP